MELQSMEQYLEDHSCRGFSCASWIPINGHTESMALGSEYLVTMATGPRNYNFSQTT